MKPRITVIGSANIDFIMQVPRLPAAAETVTGGTFMQAFGGKGANQAVAAARAGGDVTFVAALGNDVLARAYRDSLERDGIRMDFVTLEEGVAGGTALILFDRQGENYIGVAAGANERITPQRVAAAEAVIAGSDWVVLQQEIPRAANEAALQLAARHGRQVLFNYAPAADLALKPSAAMTGLVVNEVEAGALANHPFPPDEADAAVAVAQELRRQGGHRFCIVTLGRHGSAYCDADQAGHIPALAVKAVDSTAAGDTFCGALAVALGQGQPLPEAIRFAAVAGGLAVTRAGAQTSIPSRQEIEAASGTGP